MLRTTTRCTALLPALLVMLVLSGCGRGGNVTEPTDLGIEPTTMSPTVDHYAQDEDGTVYYLGERVDEIEVGAVFEQERAPGLAEDRSEVVAVDVSVTVPAGTFDDCIQTEDLDPLSDAVEQKIYCRGVGLVQEVYPGGGSLDLIEYEGG